MCTNSTSSADPLTYSTSCCLAGTASPMRMSSLSSSHLRADTMSPFVVSSYPLRWAFSCTCSCSGVIRSAGPSLTSCAPSGMLRWYSSDDGPLKPSRPKSSSYSMRPSVWNRMCRFRGTSPRRLYGLMALASLAATSNRRAANPGGAAVRGRRRQSASLAARPSARGTTRACGTPAYTSRDWPQVRLKVAACGLLALDGLEQRLEVALAEALAPFPLDDLEEQRRAVGDGAGEDLQQIAVVVSIDEDAQVVKAVQ